LVPSILKEVKKRSDFPVDEVVTFFQKFKEGDNESYWKLMLHDRIEPVFNRQIKVMKRVFSLNNDEVIELKDELYISIRRRLLKFDIDLQKDNQHQANSLFMFIQLMLLGESQKVCRYLKGTSTRDEKGYSSIKGMKLDFDGFDNSDRYEENSNPREDLSYKLWSEESRNVIEDDGDYFIHKLLFSYLQSIGDMNLYNAILMRYDNGISWSKIERMLNFSAVEKQRIITNSMRLMVVLRAFIALETSMQINITVLGIQSTEINFSMCIYDGKNRSVWSHDSITQDDITTIEGKVSDWIRKNDITWVVMNIPQTQNKIDAIIERLILRRNLLLERLDVEDLVSRIHNFGVLTEKNHWSRNVGCAYIAAASKLAELDIVRRK